MFTKHYFCIIKLKEKINMAKKHSLTNEFAAMKIGDKREYPAERCSTVYSMASMMGFRLDRKYQTETDRERRVITVTRLR